MAYTDHIIPKGSHIHKVVLFFHKKLSYLVYLEFYDISQEILLSCGVDELVIKNLVINPDVEESEFILNENERLIGIISNDGNRSMALHASVQFLVGRKND